MENTTGLFDGFDRLSNIIHRHDEMRKLIGQNVSIKSSCGSCTLWMSQQCPRESNGHKVTCNESVCKLFNMSQWHKNLIAKNDELLKQLTLNP